MTENSSVALPRRIHSSGYKPRNRSWRYAYFSSVLLGVALVLASSVSIAAVTYASAGPTRIADISAVTFEMEVSSAVFEATHAIYEVPKPAPPPAAPVTAPAVAVRSVGITNYVAKERVTNVNITFYDCANQGFCGAMYNGRKVYEGAAACSWNLAIGTKFVIIGDPTGRIYNCEDRGLLANTWVDIFFYHPADGYKWQSLVGRYGTIEIVGTP